MINFGNERTVTLVIFESKRFRLTSENIPLTTSVEAHLEREFLSTCDSIRVGNNGIRWSNKYDPVSKYSQTNRKFKAIHNIFEITYAAQLSCTYSQMLMKARLIIRRCNEQCLPPFGRVLGWACRALCVPHFAMALTTANPPYQTPIPRAYTSTRPPRYISILELQWVCCALSFNLFFLGIVFLFYVCVPIFKITSSCVNVIIVIVSIVDEYFLCCYY